MKCSVLFFMLLINHSIYPVGFVAGTLVRTQSGHVPIEQIKSGDEVLGSNESSLFDFIVTRYPAKEQTTVLVKITIDDESFCVAPDQKLFSLQKMNWVDAAKIEPGEPVGSISCDFTIDNIEIEEAPTGYCAEVYSLYLRGPGIFFVSMHDIGVYNCPDTFWRNMGNGALKTVKIMAKCAWWLATSMPR